ncbi:unnamed protein product [Cylicostephanus goldi]|uniref:Calcineurin-like phosphoesterase domain-containing protein n=1 Tax=Cylicostephanus goldi TaxID=71465 RepID=A0A3P7MG08_CYLGO|nr:unnamed protein product [Cylicostephanus goldi]
MYNCRFLDLPKTTHTSETVRSLLHLHASFRLGAHIKNRLYCLGLWQTTTFALIHCRPSLSTVGGNMSDKDELDTPVFDNKVRFVCISDTHEKLDEFLPMIPDGDVLIHAGDFTNYGDLGEVIKFNAEIGKLPHKHKIVIAGNHELGFEDGEEMNDKQLAGLNMLGINKAYELLSNCTYLCDRAIEVCLLCIVSHAYIRYMIAH